MGVNSGLMTMAQALPMTDEAHQYLVEQSIEMSTIMANGYWKNDEAGLTYPLYSQDGTVDAGMVADLAGFPRTFANSVTGTGERAFKTGFDIQLPHETYKGKKLDLVKLNQITQALLAVYSDLDSMFFYGEGDGATAFKGLHKRLASGVNVINAGGTTNRSSIYLQVFGDNDSHFFMPEGEGINEAQVIVDENALILDGSGNRMKGLSIFMQSYAGLVVHSPTAIGQIYGLDASDHPATIALIKQLFTAMSMDKMGRKRRSVLWMNSRSLEQLKDDMDKEIIRKEYADYGDMSFDTYDNVRICTTDAVLTSEAAKS